MSAIKVILFILTFAISFPSFGLSVACDDAKVFDEVVPHEYFRLRKTDENSHGSHFEIDLEIKLNDSSLKEIILYRKIDDEVEYFFNLKYVVGGLKESNAISGFTLSHRMKDGAELLAVFNNQAGLCTTIIRNYRTKI